MDVNSIGCCILEWVHEINSLVEKQDAELASWDVAWDDVNGGVLNLKDVMAARHEEVGYMQGRNIWSLKPIQECWDKTGKDPVSVRWVDTDKGDLIRSRLVARDFKGQDKDRDDLFAETPPLEAKRMLISRAATRRQDGRMRKLMFIDARKAHLNPACEKDVYIQLPAEAGCPEGFLWQIKFLVIWIQTSSSSMGEIIFQQIRRLWIYQGGCLWCCFLSSS